MFILLFFLAQTPAELEALMKASEVASKASDRYLFFAALLLLLSFCFGVIRYLLKDKESARVDHATAIKEAYAVAEVARKEHAVTMKEMYGEQTRLAAELLLALQQNKELLEKVKQALDRLAQK